MRKKWFSYFIYISLLFLVITLIRKEYIVIPEEIDYKLLSLSFIILFLGFLIQGLSYKVILKEYGYMISSRDSLISFGLTVLSRYIPGKFWVHLGRAGYITDNYNYPFDKLTFISLNTQFIGIWIVILFCSVGFMFMDISFILKISLAGFWIILSIIIFTRYFHRITQWMILKTIGKQIILPVLSIKEVFKVLPVFILYWFLYALAFYYLAVSLGADITYISLIYFPISTVIGIVSLFAPGGMGTREASLIGFFSISGVGTILATTIAAFSRIWFLAGELFAFILGLSLNLNKKLKSAKD